jgi:acyl-CoA synthetase (NDP forming)
MMAIDFPKIDRIFEKAEAEGRDFLLEPEVYGMLRAAGLGLPKYAFIPKGRAVSARTLASFRSDELVLKIVSPLIQHKTDVGGVAFVRTTAAAVNAGLARLAAEVPGRFLAWAKAHPQGHPENLDFESVAAGIRGVLLVEKVDYEKFGFGTELLVGLRNSREFGPIVSAAAGGVEVEYLNERLKEGRAVAIASAHLSSRADIILRLSSLAVYDKLVKPFRGRPAPLAAEALGDAVARFLELAARYSAFGPSSRFVIEEAEVNPFVVRNGSLVPLDGLCRFSRRHLNVRGRPGADIRPLLRPESVAVIGVSEKMNLGRIILRNILKMGFAPERVTVIKPGVASIDGCPCVPTVADLPETVDLFVLTLAAEPCVPVMEELVGLGKARSVIIIAGGLGEKEGTQSVERRIVELLASSRAAGRPTPVVNGGNCLGIYSKPGRCDTTFLPERKLRFPKTDRSDLVYISQSGAFMICRIASLRRTEPLYGISLGNQIDLRVSDFLNFLKDEREARVFAIYVEGFKPGDGYLLARAAREILKTEGRSVVLYKGGRTPEGRLATSGHTASVAGDYDVARSVLEAAGVLVAETISEFETSIAGLMALEGKQVRGNRVGLLSNAGFESVIMSDSLGDGERLELAEFTAATKAKLGRVLAPLGIDRLQDIKNPLDVTPVADDDAFAACARAILEDPGVDCAVISAVPMTPAMQTLAPADGHEENIFDPGSVSSRLIELFRTTAKPFVVNVDGGFEYDPLVAHLEDGGLPVFRRCDEAVAFLRRFVASRLRAGRKRGRRSMARDIRFC